MGYIELNHVKKEYVVGEVKITAVSDVSFSIEKGEFVVVLGPSGAGKTTILNILGGMDDLTSGEVIVDNRHIENLSKKELVDYRRYDIGFVFQFYNLVQNLTALENVELATNITKNPLNPKEVMTQVGLAERMNNFPAQMSGGEQQRTAIARALAKNPKLLLCDEPTGALDSKTGRNILELLLETNKKYNMTTVVITHNASIAKLADKIIKMKNGLIDEIIINKPLSVDEIDW